MYWDGDRWRAHEQQDAEPAPPPRRQARDWLSTGVMVIALVALIIPI